MNKTITLVVLLLIGIFRAEAVQVNEREARQRAESFMARRMTTRSVTSMSRVYVPLRTYSAMESVNDAPLYLFNQDGGGYVIVSGDDRTSEILGFSESGHLDPDRMSANLKIWLENYVRKIQHLPAHTLPSKGVTRTASIKEEITPKLKTTWGQDWPYNLHTPELHVVWNDRDTTIHAATGCVATAMAQIMNYYHYPAETRQTLDRFSGTAEIPVAYPKSRVDTVLVDWVSEVIPKGSVIDWDHITDHYDRHSTKAQLEAISRLMQYCGSSVFMQYGMESSARTDSLVYGLYETFGYEDVYLLHQMNYDAQGWIDVIYDVIFKEGPLLFGGDSPDGYGGHQFILDGYRQIDGSDYFHANWGWDGEDDGYMLLDVMAPGWILDDDGNEVGFTEGQIATPGLGPNGKGRTSIEKNLYCDTFELGREGKEYRRNSKSEGFNVEYSFYFANYDHPHTSYQMGVGIFRGEEMVSSDSFTHGIGIDLPLFWFWGGETETPTDLISVGNGLDDGTYIVKLICKVIGENDWKVCRFADDMAVRMTIKDNKAIFGSLPSGISPIQDDQDVSNSVWHTLSGTRLSGAPSSKGIYILNGRKVVVG